MRCIYIVLQRWPQITSQHMVESLLSIIVQSADQLETLPSQDYIAELYIGFSRLFATILSYHRPKLGGRYDLVVPVLQSLLRPLFVSYTLVPASAHVTSTFDQTHASTYARLLTTLCEPSPSAVAYQRRRQQGRLHDETKRAKNMAGQHLHYLIMTYVDCQLQGRLATKGMKEALEPGLWAVLGCIEEDVKRAMNVVMNTRQRSLWKRLYEDWTKFGRWQAP